MDVYICMRQTTSYVDAGSGSPHVVFRELVTLVRREMFFTLRPSFLSLLSS